MNLRPQAHSAERAQSWQRKPHGAPPAARLLCMVRRRPHAMAPSELFRRSNGACPCGTFYAVVIPVPLKYLLPFGTGP